jgi:hypothetical protein
VTKPGTLLGQAAIRPVQGRPDKKQNTAGIIMLEALPNLNMKCLVYIIWQCVDLGGSRRVIDISRVAASTGRCIELHPTMLQLLVILQSSLISHGYVVGECCCWLRVRGPKRLCIPRVMVLWLLLLLLLLVL